MSNGSLSGEPQTNYFTLKDRIAGDRLLDFDLDIYGYLLGSKTRIFDAELECRTNPNGYGKVFEAIMRTYAVSLRVYKWGIQLKIGYRPIVNINEYATTKPYCTNAGGFTGWPLFPGKNYSYTGGKASNAWILNVFHSSFTIKGNGCVSFDAHVGWNGFASGNVDMSLCSDGLHFNFVPGTISP